MLSILGQKTPRKRADVGPQLLAHIFQTLRLPTVGKHGAWHEHPDPKPG